MVLCHFSSWGSYGSYRDLWQWLYTRMIEDRSLLVPLAAMQFDHGGNNQEIADVHLERCMSWLKDQTAAVASPEKTS